MCWNRNVSIVAAVWGWVACALLAYRGGRNDRWYALYLLTFTLTQVIDAVLWSLQYDRGLEACDGRRMSFAVGAPDGQLANLIVSKYAIPAVVIIQYAAQLAYPSSRNPRLRRVMLLGYVAAGVVMCYTSGARPVHWRSGRCKSSISWHLRTVQILSKNRSVPRHSGPVPFPNLSKSFPNLSKFF